MVDFEKLLVEFILRCRKQGDERTATGAEIAIRTGKAESYCRRLGIVSVQDFDRIFKVK